MIRATWTAAFILVALVHLPLNVAGAAPWDSITKCLLAPILVVLVLRLRGPRIVAVALALCFFGDLFLTFPWFLAGMAAFGLAHVAFIAYFVSRGALSSFSWPAAVCYAIAVIAVVAWLWPGLAGGLRAPTAVYAVLLAGTAVASLSVDRLAGIGALLFLISDTIIAAGKAGYTQPPPAGLWIMIVYLLAIYVLAWAILSYESRTGNNGHPRGSSRPRPTRRA